MKPHKIVVGHTTAHQVIFVGPFGVGKTTALRTVSDIPVLNTDVASAEVGQQQIEQGKTTTTTALDYGEWRFSDGSRVSLIGVPGQERFDAMWDTLLPRSTAIVLWLYGDRDPQMLEGSKWLDALKQRNAISRLAVAITRIADDLAEEKLGPYRELVCRYHPLAPVMTADPRRPADVMQSITMALLSPFADERETT